MSNRTSEVVNHEFEQRLDLLLRVTSVVRERGIPFSTFENHASEVHSRGGDVAGKEVHEAMIKETDLHEVLAQSSGVDVIVIRLGDTTEEVHRVRITEVIVQAGQDPALSSEDLLLREAVIGDVAERSYVRGENLLVLGSNEHACNADELEAVETDHLARKETVDDVNRKEEGFGKEVEAVVDFDEPVDKDTAHLPFEIFLIIHVFGIGQGGNFKFLEVVEDLVDILCDHERVIDVFGVEIKDGLFEFLLSSLHFGGSLCNMVLLLFFNFPALFGVELLAGWFLILEWSGAVDVDGGAGA